MRRLSAGRRSDYSAKFTWLRLLAGLVILWSLSNWLEQPGSDAAQAQEERNPTLEELEAPATSGDPAGASTTPAAATSNPPARQRTLLDTIRDGGYIGVIIILLSVVAVGFIIEHAISIRKQRLMPDSILDPLEEMIARGDIAGATEYCQAPEHYCLATDVILAGLQRYQASDFGFAEYKSAAEEAGEDNTARLYRKTDVLAVIGAIAPMLGLFGTVEGMIDAFNAIAETQGSVKPADLAGPIGKALITTWLGLLVAIPSMIAFSYFRNKIDSLVSDCGKRVERILTPLARKR
jgi:biopolymer transport protein ExbB